MRPRLAQSSSSIFPSQIRRSMGAGVLSRTIATTSSSSRTGAVRSMTDSVASRAHRFLAGPSLEGHSRSGYPTGFRPGVRAWASISGECRPLRPAEMLGSNRLLRRPRIPPRADVIGSPNSATATATATRPSLGSAGCELGANPDRCGRSSAGAPSPSYHWLDPEGHDRRGVLCPAPKMEQRGPHRLSRGASWSPMNAVGRKSVTGREGSAAGPHTDSSRHEPEPSSARA